MKGLVLLLACCLPAIGQKMHVKVIQHTVDGVPYTRYVPGMATGNGSATAYGNTATASGTSIYVPPHVVSGEFTHIEMLLLLPDGRRVNVSCEDHAVGLLKGRIHTCKNPEAEELDADFSGKNVELRWGVGIDGKKKESETYIVGRVTPAKPAEVKP